MNRERHFFVKTAFLSLLLCSVLAWTGSSYAAIKLPAVIDSNMVLQQGKAVQLWGWADPGEEIEVHCSWRAKNLQGKADKDGKWRVSVDSPAAGGPYTISINDKKLDNILCGEVWVCSGQSNMQWSLSRTENFEAAIAAANYKNIRLFYVQRTVAVRVQDDLIGSWTTCTSKTAAGFSAVGYYFGRKLHKELNVPVGLINTSWGGTRIEPWTPPVGFQQVPALENIIEEMKTAEVDYSKSVAESIDEIEEWTRDARTALAANKPIPNVLKVPRHPLDHNQRPSSLYNAMVAPLVPFGIKGAIWYQGESNRADGLLYFEKMKALIGGWRNIWDQSDMPFYYVQLAPFRYGGDPTLLPQIWQAQTKALSIPNTGMAIINDIADVNNIHPKNKVDVGERLALWALTKNYGKKGIVYCGPLYKSMAVRNGRIRIRFDHAGTGLASRDGETLTWFTIAGEDRKFVKANTRIRRKSVVVWSDEVPNPVAVRFAWDQLAEPNLVNKEGLPASSFRTDDWELLPVLPVAPK